MQNAYETRQRNPHAREDDDDEEYEEDMETSESVQVWNFLPQII